MPWFLPEPGIAGQFGTAGDAAHPAVSLHPLARCLLCLGAGSLGFGFFRVGLGMLYAENLVWATFWEELTELMFVGASIYVLLVLLAHFTAGFQNSIIGAFASLD